MFTLKIKTDNAAFGETEQDRRDECARILKEIAGYFSVKGRPWRSDGRDSGACFDSNGNKVGEWKITGKKVRKCS